ncbi:CDP-alcohol phosphatidyltransferase family protein [Arthrobacter oryzae]|uniref:CDP-alcohol phosphatidyltransferase family protein n=1 Tax=Arthrobacter oryzae TaxID=409290 RepID=UPI00277FF9CC|nr:CDP-alcohol phosphatidyltransferase family protein [Arthrobacter oryzae]MDQ0077542.1 phosphatidylglycerophosphate synthase [Arthrobacter oryzae]
MASVSQRVAAHIKGQDISFRQTVFQLSSAQKTAAAGAPPYSIYVNRKAGKYVAAAAHRIGWSPNAISCVSAVLTFSGITLLAAAPSSWWVGITVWSMLALGYVFDSADGQVARLRGISSPAGEWLDHVLDCAKLPSLHLAVLIAAYRNFHLSNDVWLLVPILYSAIASVAFFSMILNDHLKTIHSGPPRSAGKKKRSVIKSIALLPTDYGALCFLFVFLGSESIFISLYSLFFLANAGHLLLASFKWFNDMKNLETVVTETTLGD